MGNTPLIRGFSILLLCANYDTLDQQFCRVLTIHKAGTLIISYNT